MGKATLQVNDSLVNYALFLSILTTKPELQQIKEWTTKLPDSEPKIIQLIGRVTMHPKYRVLQKKGRIEKLEHFNVFTHLIDAALLSYYRSNFISSYLTLVPVIEGILIRWMGYNEGDDKPEFEEIRSFFKNSYKRQPCPYNILFHDIYTKACHKILNEHFYKHTTHGQSYSNFNRHVASHLLNNDAFATRDNCIRLFLLLDAMTEIYVYETRITDPRFNTAYDEPEIKILTQVILSNQENGPEQSLLGSSLNELI